MITDCMSTVVTFFLSHRKWVVLIFPLSMEERDIESMYSKLNDLHSERKAIQNKSVTLVARRALFDAVTARYPAAQTRVGKKTYTDSFILL